jgi:CubicO group peptidase (beta-lactamase class C family)
MEIPMSENTFENDLQTFDQAVIRFMNENLLPGLVMCVVKEGQPIYTRCFGLADIANNVPMTPDSVFRIASITKTFTAIGLMQLWEQGKFKLDDPVNDYLKDYQIVNKDPQSPPITFRHLLTHRAGIGEGRDLKDLLLMVTGKFPAEVADEEQVTSMGEHVHGLLLADAYPEQKWAYANFGFGTLGQLISDISGEPLDGYMRRNVFDPLGMRLTDYHMTSALKEKLAVPYRFKKGKFVPARILYFPDQGAGSINSTVEEMALYMAALMNGGSNQHGRVLKRKTVATMMSPQYREHPGLMAMGFSFFISEENGRRFVSHGGTLDGFESLMMVAPDDKLGVVIWTNKNTLALEGLGVETLCRLLGVEERSKQIPAKNVLAPVHLWPELTGSYGPSRGFNSNARTWMILGGEVQVYAEKNQLMLRGLWGPLRKGIPLYPASKKDELLFESVVFGLPLRLAFQRNEEGFIDRLSMTILMFFTLYRRPTVQSVRFRLKAIAAALLGINLAVGAWLLRNKRRKNS